MLYILCFSCIFNILSKFKVFQFERDPHCRIKNLFISKHTGKHDFLINSKSGAYLASEQTNDAGLFNFRSQKSRRRKNRNFSPSRQRKTTVNFLAKQCRQVQCLKLVFFPNFLRNSARNCLTSSFCLSFALSPSNGPAGDWGG